MSEMRDIKFRAWDEADGLHRDKGEMSFYDVHESIGDVDFIMQYTGLKNLYESDLIKDNDGIIWEVIFWEASFMIRQVKNHNDVMPIASFYKYEIIGNIHENPELL